MSPLRQATPKGERSRSPASGWPAGERAVRGSGRSLAAFHGQYFSVVSAPQGGRLVAQSDPAQTRVAHDH